MEVYQELTLLETPEIGTAFLWEKLFQELHMALVEHQSKSQGRIAFAFPEYRKQKHPLGNKLRVFGKNEADLEALALKAKLSRFSDYIHTTRIRSVPTQVRGYVRFKRRQAKSNTERLARRYAKRHNVSMQEARQVYQNFKAQDQLRTPFVYLHSASSQKRFPLFIRKEAVKRPVDGAFSCYGLSESQATVPDF